MVVRGALQAVFCKQTRSYSTDATDHLAAAVRHHPSGCACGGRRWLMAMDGGGMNLVNAGGDF